MALTPAAFIPPGCSPQCTRSVTARSQTFAYASIQGISLYRVERRAVPDLAEVRPTSTPSTTTPPTVEISAVSLQALFGNGVNAAISAFDYNEELMACLCAQTRSVVVWRLADAEPLTAKKIPPSLGQLFRREGTPSTMCVAGKYHLLFGTTTGRLISLNTNEGPHEPKSVSIPAAVATAPQSGPSTSSLSTSTPPLAAPAMGTVAQSGGGGGLVDSVECLAVSPARADLVSCGTLDGTLCFLTLSAATGLTVTGTMIPFPPPSREKDRLVAPNALPVSVAVYDPSTPSQIVVGSAEGGLALCDSNRLTGPTLTFDTKDPVSGIAWVPGESGVFYSVSISSNLVSKWSTSSKSALATIAVADAGVGVRSIACLDNSRVVLALTSGSLRVYNLTAAAVVPVATDALTATAAAGTGGGGAGGNASTSASGPTSGGGSPTLEFETPAGHTDAVLAARFSRHDRDLVASTGVDGTIQLWNLRTTTLQSSIEVGKVMVYGVDWSPNGKYLVAALGSGEVVQYSVATQRQGWRTSVFPDLVYRVQWPAAGEANCIVASSRNGIALLSKEGQVVRRFESPGGAVYGLDVEPSRGKTFAIACNDQKVYVYSLASNSEKPVLTLSGHSDVVSDVAFNPTAPQFLLSGAYDGTLRVWDLSTNDSHTISVSARVLKGHSDRVKSIEWCSMAPYMALSGSADSTIRLWDVRNGVCVTTVRGHNADVCAICSHPERPLVFVSASRDGSFIVWYLSLLRQVYLDAVMGMLDQCIVSDAASLMAVASTANVSVSVVGGAAVQRLAKELREGTTASRPTERMERLVGFFEPPLGASDLAQLANYAVDPATYSAESRAVHGALVVPAGRLVECRRARAKFTAEKAHSKSVTSAGPAYRRRRLVEAAEEMVRVGRFEEGCNLLAEAGEWDLAMAIAPAISRAYWRTTCLRAATAMERAGDTRAITYYILAEESGRAGELMLRRSSDNRDAAVCVTRTCPQRGGAVDTQAVSESSAAVDAEGAAPASKAIRAAAMAGLYRYQNPRVMAAAQIANGCNDEAVRSLAYAGDVGLAHILVHTVPLREQQSIDMAFHMSMLLCARLRQWDMATTCAARQSNPYHSFATLLALFQFTHGKQVSRITSHSVTSASMATIQSVNDKLKTFYEQLRAECAKLQLPMDAAAIQQRHASDGLASQNQIAAMVLQSDPAMGPVTSAQTLQSIAGFMGSLLAAALQDVDGPSAGFYLRQAYNVSAYVALPIVLPARGATPASPSPAPLSVPVGGLMTGVPGAVATPAPSTSPPALNVEHRKLLCLSLLTGALMCVKVYRMPSMLNPMFTKARELTSGDAALDALVGQVQAALGTYSPHSVSVSCTPVGAVIPAMGGDGKQLLSSVSAQPIFGPVHLLEDSTSMMSKEEALAWSMCCQFSPLASGARMAVL